MKNLSVYENLKNTPKTEFTTRIFTEIDYALQVNKAHDSMFSDTIDKVIAFLADAKHITKAEVTHAEDMMSEIGKLAKTQECLCIAHAHIDVNWMWGFDETVAITLSTFDTMLKLLDEYPDFTFSQSTGFVFKIVERYRPEMLERIKKYVKEGRFEITGATFVEADKNSPSASSLLRHTEYTKKYLSRTFDIPEEEFVIDFEPDTFGHTLYEPEILATNGIKYLYHCRGNNLPPIYRWFAPSGKSILVYREPFWYNGAVEYGDFEFVPDFCTRYGVNKTLRVYGVGDHGGGITMRDVERIREIATYPIMANIRFGTYREFFDHLATIPNIPEVRGEQNDIFTGCYSSISELKIGNSEAEKALYEQELFCAPDTKRDYDNSDAVERILVNHFHDIITGSGIDATKAYALSRLQEAKAELGAYKDEALRHLEKRLNTLPLYKKLPDKRDEISLGAGVGFGVKDVNFTNYISYGKERAYIVFNQLNFKRDVTVALPLWDYYGNISALKAFDSEGNPLPFGIKSETPEFYWYHNFHEVKVALTLEAFEYRAIVLREDVNYDIKEIAYPPLFQRTEVLYDDVTLENDLIKAVFDRKTFALKELTEKASGKNLIKKDSGFRLLTEDITEQMTAWYVGRIKDEVDINVNPRFISSSKSDVAETLTYELKFRSSVMTVTATVNKNEKGVRLHGDVDFREIGSPVDGIPNLRFKLNVGDFEKTVSDADPGLITRPARDKDVSAFSFTEANGVTLIAPGKHGFRGNNGELGVCLLRASCDPHPLPEYGKRSFDLGVFVSPEDELEKLRLSSAFRYTPAYIPLSPHDGDTPVNGKYISGIPSDAVCLSVRRNDVTLFNPYDREITVNVLGNDQTIPPYSVKKFTK